MVVFREAFSYIFKTSSYCSASKFSLLNNCVDVCVERRIDVRSDKREREREREREERRERGERIFLTCSDLKSSFSLIHTYMYNASGEEIQTSSQVRCSN